MLSGGVGGSYKQDKAYLSFLLALPPHTSLNFVGYLYICAKGMRGYKHKSGWRERTYFNVHYLEREIVKELGAKFDFDPSVKKWYTDTAHEREELLNRGYSIVEDKYAIVKPQRTIRLTIGPSVPLEDRKYFHVPYDKLHIVKAIRGAHYSKSVGLWYVDKNVCAHVDAMTTHGLEVVDDYAVTVIAMDRETNALVHTKKKKRQEKKDHSKKKQ